MFEVKFENVEKDYFKNGKVVNKGVDNGKDWLVKVLILNIRNFFIIVYIDYGKLILVDKLL